LSITAATKVKNTARGHLHRLKKKDFIEQHGTYWRLRDKEAHKADGKRKA
jgi:hypothetical protein